SALASTPALVVRWLACRAKSCSQLLPGGSSSPRWRPTRPPTGATSFAPCRRCLSPSTPCVPSLPGHAEASCHVTDAGSGTNGGQLCRERTRGVGTLLGASQGDRTTVNEQSPGGITVARTRNAGEESWTHCDACAGTTPGPTSACSPSSPTLTQRSSKTTRAGPSGASAPRSSTWS